MLTVKNIVDLVEKTAKPQYAYSWDNCGLQVGNGNNNVTRVLTTLDVTCETIEEAKNNNCEMIVSHHPLIMSPVSSVTSDTYQGKMIELLNKYGISLYCAHTSLDIAQGGVNDALCEKLSLSDVKLLAPFVVDGEEIACARVGKLPRTMDKHDLIQFIKERTGAPSIVSGALKNKSYSTIALCTGGGADFGKDAKKAGADVFLTGEIKYHDALELKRIDMPFIAAGHFYTEYQIAEKLALYLQKKIDVLQCGVTVIKSSIVTDPFDR